MMPALQAGRPEFAIVFPAFGNVPSKAADQLGYGERQGADSSRPGLHVNGKLIVLGAPHEPLEVPALLLIGGRRSVAGWYSGTSIDSQDTLSFSRLSGVRAMTEVFPLERAAEAYERMMSGKARFRVVLTTGQ